MSVFLSSQGDSSLNHHYLYDRQEGMRGGGETCFCILKTQNSGNISVGSWAGSWALFLFVPQLFYRSYFVSHKLHFSHKSIMMKMASE